MDCYVLLRIVICKNATPVHDEGSGASYVSILEPGGFHKVLGELGTQVRTLLTSLAELRTPPAERLDDRSGAIRSSPISLWGGDLSTDVGTDPSLSANHCRMVHGIFFWWTRRPSRDKKNATPQPPPPPQLQC